MRDNGTGGRVTCKNVIRFVYKKKKKKLKGGKEEEKHIND
jgi:hypothetical protein